MLTVFISLHYVPEATPFSILHYGRFTGQEKEDEKHAIAAAPPAFILTNFMMLKQLSLTTKDVVEKVTEPVPTKK